MKRTFVIEDDRKIARQVRGNHAHDAATRVHAAVKNLPELLLLVGLPDSDGFAMAQEIQRVEN